MVASGAIAHASAREKRGAPSADRQRRLRVRAQVLHLPGTTLRREVDLVVRHHVAHRYDVRHAAGTRGPDAADALPADEPRDHLLQAHLARVRRTAPAVNAAET
jgi:hypothetical protein